MTAQVKPTPPAVVPAAAEPPATPAAAEPTPPEAAPTPQPPAAPVDDQQPHRMSTKDKLRQAKLPTKKVPICLSTDLQEQHEALEAQLRDARLREQTDPRLAGNPSAGIARQIRDLEEQMAEFVVVFEIKSIGKRWSKLVKEHPPRDGDAEDTYLGFNPDTFFDAAIRACCVAPDDLDDDDWLDLLGDDDNPGKLTAGQYKQLEDAVLHMNVKKLDVPNSLAASRILSSEPA